MQEAFIASGCFNIPTPCPDPILWLVVGTIIGLWMASTIWLAYLHRLKEIEEEMEDEE
jgi:hypothetical protein